MPSRRRVVIAVLVTGGAALLLPLAPRPGPTPSGRGGPDVSGWLTETRQQVADAWGRWRAKRETVRRLRQLGPVGSDGEVSQAQLDEWGELVDRIERAPPDAAYIRPLLASFGTGDGFEMYTHGVWALLKQDRAKVVAAAVDTLETGGDGPRRWALETLGRIRRQEGSGPPSERELRLVQESLHLPPEVAEAAVYYAYWLGGPEGRNLLERAAREAEGYPSERAKELLAKLDQLDQHAGGGEGTK